MTSTHNFFKGKAMAKIALLAFCSFIIVCPVIAVDLGIEKSNNDYLLFVTSDKPVVISSFVLQLNYNHNQQIFDVKAAEPFMLVANIQNNDCYTRIAAASGQFHTPALKKTLAIISATDGFSPDITVKEIFDGDENLLLGDLQVHPKPSPTIPDYQSDMYQSPEKQETTIPEETRVQWTATEHVILSGTIPIVTSVTEPGADEMIADDVDEEKGIQPSDTNKESSHLPIATDPLLDPATYTEQEEIPAEGSPLSIITIIVGLSIAMLICKRGLYP